MHKVMLALLIALSFATAGCKKKGGGASDSVGKMEGFANDMCACKDKACGDKVNAAMAKWGEEMAKEAAGKTSTETPDPEVGKKMAAATTKMTECFGKLAAAGAPGSAEGAPGSAAGAPGSAEGAPGSAADKKPDDGSAGGW